MQTNVLKFDDLPAAGQFVNAMPTGYGGIDWQGGNWVYLVCDSGPNPCPGPDPNVYPYQPKSAPAALLLGGLAMLGWRACRRG